MQNIAIIGGGITGLASAFYLQKFVKEHHLDVKFTLIEAAPKLGGKVQTVRKNGFVVEKGPDSFIKRKVAATELIKEVGLEDDLVTNATGKSYILKADQLYPIPEDAVMGVPTRLGPFISSGLFSPLGKARAAMDLMHSKSNNDKDQSVGYFFRRRLGNEVVDYLIEPLLSGIYASNIDELSLQATFPNFLTLEQKYRSLIVGMRKMRATTPNSNGKKTGQFYTLKGGLESLVNAVTKELPDESILLNTSVSKLTKQSQGYCIDLENNDKIYADKVIVTVPYEIAKGFLPEEQWLNNMRPMSYTTVANVALIFSENQVIMEHEGTGFVVSRKDDYRITACTWTNKKWPHSTPDGKVLLRCYVGRPGMDDVSKYTDRELTQVVLNDLKRVMKVVGEPEDAIISRWKEAMPQYKIGHKEWVEEVMQKTSLHLPGMYFTGSSFDGVGIADCIRQGKETVEKLVSSLSLPS